YNKALYKYAWTAYLQKKHQKSIQQFTKLLETNSGEKNLLRNEAIRYLALSFLDASNQSTQKLKQHIAQFKTPIWARDTFIQLGDSLAKYERNKDAVKSYQAAIALEPENPDNLTIHQKLLPLDPNPELRKSLIAQFSNTPKARPLIQQALFELAVDTHTKAKAQKDPELFKKAAYYYAQYARSFKEQAHLDEVLFYYAEACFAAKQFEYAAAGFVQVRDWPWSSDFKEQAALNAIHTWAKEASTQYPSYNLSKVELPEDINHPKRIPQVLFSYEEAIDAFAKQAPDHPDIPSLLLQAGGIHLSHGHFEKAYERFDSLIKSYPKYKAASSAAKLWLAKLIQEEAWSQAAELASRFQNQNLHNKGKEFQRIVYSIRFKKANQLYTKAETLEEYDQIANQYIDLLENNPNAKINDKILFNAATAFKKANRLEKAAKAFKQIERQFPRSKLAKQARLERARYFERLLQFGKAAPLYMKLGQTQNILRAALNWEAAEKYRKAGQTFEKFIQNSSTPAEQVEAYSRAIEAYKKARNKKKARRIQKRFIKRYRGKLAQADYLKLEPQFKYYQSLWIRSKSTTGQGNQLTKQLKKLDKLQKGYEAIIAQYPASQWTTKAVQHIGGLYEHLWRSMLKAPCPRDVKAIGSNACQEYASLLQEKAGIIAQKAKETYELALQKADQQSSTILAYEAQNALHRVAPENYDKPNAPWEKLEFEATKINLDTLMKRLKSNPADIEARILLSQIFYQQKRWAAMELTLQGSLIEEPDSSDVQLWLEHLNRATGRSQDESI
ncbi:MAG: tetratricopeptide repeat protein, partial [Deltaproteobacteria bacterium]|nr:tetratricopeptide repeat protein [Deltaproteobacteria bacterium]